ncbi:MAG: hypothetical protein FRX48_08953 [Lasallia pustulata]|uniref:Sld7 C-terminal domain-containing protein n=1 Tax=Lasallia pustulata TaxID=136370 RepID=A0A5M8PEL9_9LECA|nr:MAG: hypothetical protein FRX48_08953 [Lasallia pustulata]
MEVWSGDVLLDDSAGKIQDVGLECTHSTSQLWLSPSARLRFLSFVNPSGIPLHLAAGPSLGVWTTNEDTEQWFYNAIVRDGVADRGFTDGAGPTTPWWQRGGGQSDRGILFGVDSGIEPDGHAGPKITELLLYALTGPNQTSTIALPTPPASSSLSPDAGEHHATSENNVPQARIYALPMSSELLHRYDISQVPHSPPPESLKDGYGQFLPPLADEHHPTHGSARKRSRISSLFDDATQRQRKVRKKGGVSISEAMANLERPPSSHGPTLSTLKWELEDDAARLLNEEPQEMQTQRVGLSRSASAASLGARPLSSRGAIADGKGSSLRRVASIATMDDMAPVPEGEISIEQQNKNALSRLVMAGMRIYGLQQRKKSSRSRAVSEVASSIAINPDPAQLQDSDDEYKLVYHQAFKGASFTFRKSVATKLISQETMRDVVDRLLALFCTDPFAMHEHNEGFGRDLGEGRGGFDSPSGKAGLRASDGTWSTPRVRRRHRDGCQHDVVEMRASPSRRVTVPAVT